MKHKEGSVIDRLVVLLTQNEGRWFAVHEAAQALFFGEKAWASCNNVATTLNTLERVDKVLVSRYREGKPYKEWAAVKSRQLDLSLSAEESADPCTSAK